MQIWYLSPFLLALLVWWVATRKHPDEREKWTWWALGLVSGAVLMFVIVYVAQQKAGQTTDLTKVQSHDVERDPTLTLRSDTTMEVLPPTRITQNRSVGIGSLMVTLVAATQTKARVQLEPHDELELFGALEWLYESNADSGETSMSRIATQLALGKDLSFAFHGRNYRLGLLDIQLPLRGLGSSEFQDLFDAHVVVRLLDVGPYLTCASATRRTRGGSSGPTTGGGNVPPSGEGANSPLGGGGTNSPPDGGGTNSAPAAGGMRLWRTVDGTNSGSSGGRNLGSATLADTHSSGRIPGC